MRWLRAGLGLQQGDAALSATTSREQRHTGPESREWKLLTQGWHQTKCELGHDDVIQQGDRGVAVSANLSESWFYYALTVPLSEDSQQDF